MQNKGKQQQGSRAFQLGTSGCSRMNFNMIEGMGFRDLIFCQPGMKDWIEKCKSYPSIFDFNVHVREKNTPYKW